MFFANKSIDLTCPRVMGILNVTPDSFSDGGRFNQLDSALFQADSMVAAGASFIDIGGESTRPGAAEVTVQEELDRVLPVVEAINQQLDCVISLDTSKPEVMAEGIRLGVGLINDVRALQQPGATEVLAKSTVPVCLMHMQGKPRTMQNAPDYGDVIESVKHFFVERINACVEAGIERDNIILDPGFGFGKTVEHNYQLMAHLSQFHALNQPMLIGVSRKSMIGAVLDKPVSQRLAGSLALAALAVQQGAQIIRVHDVEETVDVVKVVTAVREQE